MADIDYDDLDPGIRRVVRLLNQHGFRTSDSGDGSKAATMPCAVDYPMVVIPVDGQGEMVADRVFRLLTTHSTISWEPTMTGLRYPQVDYCYLPAYGNGVVTVQNLLDVDLIDGAGEA